jgi:hypothetical protein
MCLEDRDDLDGLLSDSVHNAKVAFNQLAKIVAGYFWHFPAHLRELGQCLGLFYQPGYEFHGGWWVVPGDEIFDLG